MMKETNQHWSYLARPENGTNSRKVACNTSGPGSINLWCQQRMSMRHLIMWWCQQWVSHQYSCYVHMLQSAFSIWGGKLIFSKNLFVMLSIYAFMVKYFYSHWLFLAALSTSKAHQVHRSVNYSICMSYFFSSKTVVVNSHRTLIVLEEPFFAQHPPGRRAGVWTGVYTRPFHSRDGHCRGRYASSWNAYLLQGILLKPEKKN